MMVTLWCGLIYAGICVTLTDYFMRASSAPLLIQDNTMWLSMDITQGQKSQMSKSIIKFFI